MTTCAFSHYNTRFEQVCPLWLFCYLTMLGAYVWGRELITWLVFVIVVVIGLVSKSPHQEKPYLSSFTHIEPHPNLV